MKKAIIILAVLALATAGAQGQNYEREGKTFVQSARKSESADQVTAYFWRDTKGHEYPIILHTYTKGEKAGRTIAYVVRKSAKSGKDYKYYLPNGEQIASDILKETK